VPRGDFAGRKGLRLYPFDRIRAVLVTARRFTPGKGAHAVDAFLRRDAGAFRGGTVRDVRIRIRPGKSSWATKQILHPDQRLQFELDGSAVLEFPEASFIEVLDWCSSMQAMRP